MMYGRFAGKKIVSEYCAYIKYEFEFRPTREFPCCFEMTAREASFNTIPKRIRGGSAVYGCES